MGREKKEISFIKQCKQDEELFAVIKCKKCGQIHEIIDYNGQKIGVIGLKCGCQQILIDNYKVNDKEAELLYQKEGRN